MTIMKNYLIAASLAVASLASTAGTVGVLPNKAGGRIQLTDGNSQRCNDLTAKTGSLWQYVVATASDGSTAKGCWATNKEDMQVEIRWGADLNYTTSLFDLSDITRTEYNSRTYDDNGKPRAAAGSSL